MRTARILALGLICCGLAAGDLPPALVARFMVVLARNSSDPGRVCSRDRGLNEELRKLGLGVDLEAKIAWAQSRSEVEGLARLGKLVVCERVDFLAEGASVALVEEDGRPAIYLHLKNVYKSKASLNPDVYRMLGANLK